MREVKIGDKSYKIHYGQNSLCALEDRYGKSITEILQSYSKGLSINDFRNLIWAGMLKFNRTLTPDTVGDLCDTENVNLTELFKQCFDELNASFARLIPDTNAQEKTTDTTNF